MVKNRLNGIELAMLERRIRFINEIDQYPGIMDEMNVPRDLLLLSDVASTRRLIEQLEKIQKL